MTDGTAWTRDLSGNAMDTLPSGVFASLTNIVYMCVLVVDTRIRQHNQMRLGGLLMLFCLALLAVFVGTWRTWG